MALRPYSCGNCGHWQRWFAPPPSCPVCTDVRNALPEDGWDFATDTTRRRRAAGGPIRAWRHRVLCEPQSARPTVGCSDRRGRSVGGGPAITRRRRCELRRRGGSSRLRESRARLRRVVQLQTSSPRVLAICWTTCWTAFRVTGPLTRHELAPDSACTARRAFPATPCARRSAQDPVRRRPDQCGPFLLDTGRLRATRLSTAYPLSQPNPRGPRARAGWTSTPPPPVLDARRCRPSRCWHCSTDSSPGCPSAPVPLTAVAGRR